MATTRGALASGRSGFPLQRRMDVAPATTQRDDLSVEFFDPDRALARERFRVGTALLGLTLAAVVLVASGAPAGLRAPVILLALVLVPGWPLVARLPVDLWTLLTLDICAGLGTCTLLAITTVELHIWHPMILGLAITVISGGANLVTLQRQRGLLADEPVAPRLRLPFEPLWLVSLASAVLWVVAMLRLHINDSTVLGPLGLVPRLGLPYWVGLVALLVSTAVLTQKEQLRHALIATNIALLAVLLYATPAVVEPVPHYAYLYKHIGITQYIERYGSVDASIDIYHRWPGFFSLSALFSQLGGMPDPTHYAAWAELFFGIIDILLVRAAGKALTGSSRVAWTSALLFALVNWVGQDYYSPQALGYVFMLAITLCVLLALQGPSGAVGQRVGGLGARLLRVRQVVVDPTPSMPSSDTRQVLFIVLLLDVALVVSHQLTPYVLSLQLLTLALLGLLRPRLVAVVSVLVTLAYLVPNYDYVTRTFGLLSAPDPLANATTKLNLGTPLFDERVISSVATASFLGIFGLGLLGIVRRARRGHLRQALFVSVLALSPLLTVVAQSYGGEAKLRVLLYAMPWCCVAATWAWSPDMTRRARSQLIAPVATTVIAGLMFIVLFYGHEDQALLSPGEIGTAAFAANPALVPPGSVLVLTGANFPSRYGALYFHLAYDPPVINQRGVGGLGMTPAQVMDLNAVARVISRQVSKPTGHAYLVFSRGEMTYDRDQQTWGPHTPQVLQAFEDEVAASPRFKLVYLQRTARIYQLIS